MPVVSRVNIYVNCAAFSELMEFLASVADEQRPGEVGGNDGVIANDERTFLAAGLGVLQAPGLHAIGFDEKVHAAAVEQFGKQGQTTIIENML